MSQDDLNTVLATSQDTLAQLVDAAKKNDIIATLQPRIAAAINKTYSPGTLTQFILIQNAHPPAPALLRDIHCAFHDIIRKEHAAMVRARARQNSCQAAEHAARICHHTVYGQEFLVTTQCTQAHWITYYNQRVTAFVQSLTYHKWVNSFATQLVFYAYSAQAYAEKRFNDTDTWDCNANAQMHNAVATLIQNHPIKVA